MAVVIIIRRSEKKRKERLAKMPRPENPIMTNMGTGSATGTGAFSYGQMSAQGVNQTQSSNSQIAKPEQNAQDSELTRF